MTGIIIARTLNLRDPILRKINLVRARKNPHRVKHVQHGRIGIHESSLKEPEEPLLFQHGADVLDLGLRVSVQAGGGEVLDRAIDRTDGDERAADVQDTKTALDFCIHDTSLPAIVIELGSQRDECCHQEELKNQSCLK